MNHDLVFLGSRPIHDTARLDEEVAQISTRLEELNKNLSPSPTDREWNDYNREYDFLLNRLQFIGLEYADNEKACYETLAVLRHNEQIEKQNRNLMIAAAFLAIWLPRR